jgi:hypothetical protein
VSNEYVVAYEKVASFDEITNCFCRIFFSKFLSLCFFFPFLAIEIAQRHETGNLEPF